MAELTSSAAAVPERVQVFFPYAEEDSNLRDKLANYLRILVRQGVIEDWWPRKIDANTTAADIVDENSVDAQLFLPLISPDFVATGYLAQEEMAQALERHRSHRARLIPLLLYPTDLKETPLSGFDTLPTDGRALIDWADVDDALANVAAGIRAVVQELVPGANFGLAAAVPMPLSTASDVRALPRAWNVPYPRNPYFVGRDAYLEGLHHGRRPGLVQVIAGPISSGKTSVAVEFAYRYAADYRIVWWLRAEHLTTASADYAALAWRAELPERTSANQDLVLEAVRKWLSRRRDWLLVFDNVSDWSSLAPLVPPQPQGHILVTSRRAAWDSSVDVFSLPQLSAEEAVSLVQKRTATTEHTAAEALVDVLGVNPWTLVQATAYLNETNASAAGHAEELRDAEKRMGATGESANVGGRIDSIVDALTTVEIQALVPPYTTVQRAGSSSEEVLAGAYRVRFRLGADVIYEQDVYVNPGETIRLAPYSELSRPVADDFNASTPGDAMPPAGMGSAATVQRVVSLASLAIQPSEAAGLDDASRPLSIVVAIEGDNWGMPTQEVLSSTGVWIRPSRPADGTSGTKLELKTVEGAIAMASAGAPEVPFSIEVASTAFGRLRLAAAALDGRLTAIAIRLTSSGHIDVTECIVQVPGRTYPEKLPIAPYSRMLRALGAAQKLYGAGQLVSVGAESDYGDITKLFSAEWRDPIASCMAFFAMRDALDAGIPYRAITQQSLETLGHAIAESFGDLADSKVILTILEPSRAPTIVERMIHREEVPILARASSLLAAQARSIGRDSAAAVFWGSRLLPDQPWTLTWDDVGSDQALRAPSFSEVEHVIDR